jgi:hypothetical protein
MTYEEFAAAYTRQFQLSMWYGPNTIGGKEATERMAELADNYPEFAERAENEYIS